MASRKPVLWHWAVGLSCLLEADFPRIDANNHFVSSSAHACPLHVRKLHTARWRNGDAETGNCLVSWFNSRLGLQGPSEISRAGRG
jgi:hypothetical protein